MTKVKQLNAFIQNFYKGNATVLGDWKTASHVQRAAKRKKGETIPAVTLSSLAASPATIDADASTGMNGNGKQRRARGEWESPGRGLGLVKFLPNVGVAGRRDCGPAFLVS